MARFEDISQYIKRGKLWEAFASDEQVVLLIDEVDKADIEFPNDLLVELDRMEFFVYETGETIKARHRPIIIITSNNEKELPDAFLRRCFFHFINFPNKETMKEIIAVHYPKIKKSLVQEALEVFFELREIPGLKKKPSTSELIDWLKLLMADDIPDEVLKIAIRPKRYPPLRGAAEERAGRAASGAPGLYASTRGALTQCWLIFSMCSKTLASRYAEGAARFA